MSAAPDLGDADPFAPLLAGSVEDVLSRLAAHPDTRAHVADSGFERALRRLREPSSASGFGVQQRARACMDDPRLMQAAVTLSGRQRLIIAEDDLRRAEIAGAVA